MGLFSFMCSKIAAMHAREHTASTTAPQQSHHRKQHSTTMMNAFSTAAFILPLTGARLRSVMARVLYAVDRRRASCTSELAA